MSDHEKIMEALKKNHDSIIKLIGRSDVIYLDYPIHGNVGDLLIMAGTLDFFEKNSIKIKSAYPYKIGCEIQLSESDVIVFQGGGNLGDIYLEPQRVREHIVSQFPKNKIIILPQSIHFIETKNFEKCKNIFAKHNDLHIFARDKSSHILAKQMTKNVYLTPDMAHHLYPLMDSSKSAKIKMLYMYRNDSEAKGDLKLSNSTTTHDWNSISSIELPYLAKFFLNFSYFISLNRYTNKFQPLVFLCWKSIIRKTIKKSVKFFNSYESVTTDRLHGHIFSCLLDKQNICYDNSYGKVYSYIDAWTMNSPLVIKGDIQ